MRTISQRPAATSAMAAMTVERRKTLIQRVLELGDQVLDMLDADRQAHEAVADAEAGAHVLRQRGVRHDRRVFDQAFYPAETLGEGEELAALEKAARCTEPSLQHRAHHAAVALVHLLRGEQMLRVARQTRIDHAFHLRVLL